MDSAEGKVMPMQAVGPADEGAWKKPWVAYHVMSRPGWKGRVWSRVGTAWLNRDGSISLQLEAIPINGRLNIREEVMKTTRRSSEPGALALAAEQIAPGRLARDEPEMSAVPNAQSAATHDRVA